MKMQIVLVTFGNWLKPPANISKFSEIAKVQFVFE